MSDLTARAIADLKAELAESKAEANKVTESMGSEILRLQCELEQQRTRAEAAEQELREERQRVNSGEWVEKAHAETLDKACKELEAKLAAAEQELREQHAAYIAPMSDKLAAEREKRAAILSVIDVGALEPFDIGPCVICGPWELRERGEKIVVRHEVMQGVFAQLATRIAEKVPGAIESIRRLYRADDKLAAARAHLAGVDWQDLNRFVATKGPALAPTRSDTLSLIAAAREVLS